jgi:TusA-related sulfurtransferase
MAETLDCKGMKCPQPVLKVAIKAKTFPAGETLIVHADCSTFPSDVEKWCKDNGKVLISCLDNGGSFTATIQF